MIKRNQKGTMAEFGPAMIVFVCFIMTPLIDVSAIPVRYLIAQGVLAETAQKLALAESRTEAVAIAENGQWRNILRGCGVTVTPQPLKLIVCGKEEADRIVLNPGEPVPPQYLPAGVKAPCIYSMELSVIAALPPLYNGTSGLPGFTAPINVNLSARSNWENMGRDPGTRRYFINE